MKNIFKKNNSVDAVNRAESSSAEAGKSSAKRKKALLVSLAILLCCTTLVTTGLLIKVAPAVKNIFNPPVIENEIVEEFDETEKKSVAVKNNGNCDEFVRATVVVNWQDASGNVCAIAPVAGTDYSFTANTTNWQKNTADGFWYYKTLLEPGATTENLLASSVVALKKAPDGYTLSVEIIAEGIQANPKDAVSTAWGLSAEDGKLVFN